MPDYPSNFVKFPEEVIALQTELARPEHTKRREWLIRECVEMRKLDTVLGMLAASLGIAIEGYVLQTEICTMLTKKLISEREKAVPMIVTDTASIDKSIEHSGQIILLNQSVKRLS